MISAGERGERWFTAIYAAHYPDVVRYGIRRLADMDASTELAQDVFIIAWRRRAEVPDNGLPWLYGVARRLLANHWRARRTHPAVHPVADIQPFQPSMGIDHPESTAVMADLRATLARLPTADQEILRLIAWEQLTITEAAAVLGCSHTAAKVRLHRARRRLIAAMAAPVSTARPQRPMARERT